MATVNHRQAEPAHVIGTALLDDGLDAYLVPSGSEPGSTHLVRIVRPDGRYVCDCRAAQYGKRCKHVNAAIDQDLRDILRAGELRKEAQAWKREHSSVSYGDAAFSMWM